MILVGKYWNATVIPRLLIWVIGLVSTTLYVLVRGIVAVLCTRGLVWGLIVLVFVKVALTEMLWVEMLV